MSAAEALLLDRSMRFSRQESALEQGWLLAEMEQRFSYSLEELAWRFDRSVSWVGRRLALVELLPAAIQQQVQTGKIAAQLAMKYLVPIARVNAEDCERMAAIWVKHHCDTRQAAQLYKAWREGSRLVRERILSEPELFLKTQRPADEQPTPAGVDVERDLEMAVALLQRVSRRFSTALPEMDARQQERMQQHMERARRELNRLAERLEKEQTKHAESSATERHSGDERPTSEHPRDRSRVEVVAASGTASSAFEVHTGAGDSAGGESRTLPATDPRSVDFLQGESCASP
jgi:hypothetical protein